MNYVSVSPQLLPFRREYILSAERQLSKSGMSYRGGNNWGAFQTGGNWADCGLSDQGRKIRRADVWFPRLRRTWLSGRFRDAVEFS
jgi:hypothetical protein